MMQRTLLLFCLVAATAVDARAQLEPIRVMRADGKVTAPVEIEIVPLADPGPGMRRVRIVARPTVDAASLSIDVSAEAGLALRAPAEAAWTVPARVGQEVSRELDLSVTGPGELRLLITATVKHEGGVSQTGHTTFAFNPAPEDGAAKRALRVPTDPGGRVIVEVRASRP
jgi:hypothetical protein